MGQNRASASRGRFRLPGRHGPALGYFGAQAISVTGNRMSLVVVPWVVFDLTGSAALTGWAAALATMPAVLAGPFGGALVDRLGLRRSAVGADIISAGATLALLAAAVRGNVTALMVALVIGSVFDLAGDVARRSMIPAVAEASSLSLDRASAIHDVTYRAAMLTGAPLGGLLLALTGEVPALMLNAVSFIVSAAILSCLRGVEEGIRSSDSSERAGVLSGVQFVLHQRPLLWLIVLFAVASAFELAYTSVVLPTTIQSAGIGAQWLGLAVGAIGLGTLVGATTALSDRFSPQVRAAVLVVGLLISGPGKYLAISLFASHGWVLVALIFVCSIAAGPVNPISGAWELRLIPGPLRGRVFGLMSAALVGASSLGALGVATSLEHARGFNLLGLAVLYSVLLVLLLFLSPFRSLLANPPTAVEAT